MKFAVVVFLLATGAVLAVPARADDDWTRLKGAALSNAFAAQRLFFDDGTQQSFGEDGSTRKAGQIISRGYWKIDTDDRYCEDWRPVDEWTCYKVHVNADGTKLRLTDAEGAATLVTFRSR